MMQRSAGIFLCTFCCFSVFSACTPPHPVWENDRLYIRHGCAANCDSERSRRFDICAAYIFLMKDVHYVELSSEEYAARRDFNEKIAILTAACIQEAENYPNSPQDPIL